MTVTIPGYSTLTGQPAAILKLMQEARFFDTPEGDEYIQTIVKDSERLFGITLKVEGETYEERAESLLREMAAHNLIKIEEE